MANWKRGQYQNMAIDYVIVVFEEWQMQNSFKTTKLQRHIYGPLQF